MLAAVAQPSTLLVDDHFVYWSDGSDRTIARVSKDGMGASAQRIGSSAFDGQDLRADGDTLYYAACCHTSNTQGAVVVLAKDGSSLQTISDIPAGRLVVSGDYLYVSVVTAVARGQLLARISKDGQQVDTFYPQASERPPFGLAADDQHLYITESLMQTGDPPSGLLGAVVAIPLDLAAYESGGGFKLSADTVNPTAILVDDTFVFWVDTFHVTRRAKDSHGPSVLWQGYTAPYLAMDDTFVYWIEYDTVNPGRLLRARKDGTSLTAELLIDQIVEPSGVAVDTDAVYYAGNGGIFKLAK